ncbi:hypothetical protein C5167_023294 [Papaver somniferum]|uniref:Uncharacterized protein n=1 Tax=Papaver somniferum TaxID=3469 RepID=A0A4Y7JKB4_PAPSO|nr:hypothetical protein C5167_023294 [Papaver somniferum]
MYTGAQVVPNVVFRLKGGTLRDNRRIMNIDVWTLILRRNLPFYSLEQILPDMIKYWVFLVTLGFTAQGPCRESLWYVYTTTQEVLLPGRIPESWAKHLHVLNLYHEEKQFVADFVKSLLSFTCEKNLLQFQ